MSDLSALFTEKAVRSIWKELMRSSVPIVNSEDLKESKKFAEKIKTDISSNLYMPGIGHGYYGFNKSSGCTRFVPILSKEDMAVYYILILSIQEEILHDQPGVFGGWLSVPKKVSNSKKSKINNTDVQSDNSTPSDEWQINLDAYFSNTINKKAWFQNWQSFMDLIKETVAEKPIGPYVITSDIANFYDTISIDKLINNIRCEIPQHQNVADIIEMFLRYWDRRLKGYSPSTKGIPQEIITDASRTLSHFYLKSVDIDFLNYSNKNDLVYIRWADDFLIFGKSKKQLEMAVHVLSRMLMKIGLNLNAAKTKIYSKSDYIQFRGIEVLNAIDAGRVKAVERVLKKFEKKSLILPSRKDTVLRALIGYCSNSKTTSIYIRNFIFEEIKQFDQISGLTSQAMKKVIEISDDKKQRADGMLSTILRFPYASPRGEFLRMLWHHKKWLLDNGFTQKNLDFYINRIRSNSGESEIIESICCVEAESRIKA